MKVCPQCGAPLANQLLPTECGRCNWVGEPKDAIHVEGAEVAVDEFRDKLERFYKDMAYRVAPIVGRLLVDHGLVKGPEGLDREQDQARVDFLAKVLRASTQGSLAGISKMLREELDHGGRN